MREGLPFLPLSYIHQMKRHFDAIALSQCLWGADWPSMRLNLIEFIIIAIEFIRDASKYYPSALLLLYC